MTANKIDISWKADRSTGVTAFHTQVMIANVLYKASIIPSRTRTLTWNVFTPLEAAIGFGSAVSYPDAIQEVEEFLQDQANLAVPTAPVNPSPSPIDGVPLPKGVVYNPDIPIQKQLKRRVDSTKDHPKNETIICGKYRLSIQCNEYVYCSPRENLADPSKYESYELAIMDENSDWAGKRVLPHRHECDDVMGWVEPKELEEIARFLCSIPADYKSPEWNGKKNFEPEEKATPEVNSTPKMKFYTYRQNNSGGGFNGPAVYVIVEAANCYDANRKAEENGLYFDGRGDCDCCGKRWSEAFGDDEGTETPEIYDTPARRFREWTPRDVVIFYADGREERFDTIQEKE